MLGIFEKLKKKKKKERKLSMTRGRTRFEHGAGQRGWGALQPDQSSGSSSTNPILCGSSRVRCQIRERYRGHVQRFPPLTVVLTPMLAAWAELSKLSADRAQLSISAFMRSVRHGITLMRQRT